MSEDVDLKLLLDAVLSQLQNPSVPLQAIEPDSPPPPDAHLCQLVRQCHDSRITDHAVQPLLPLQNPLGALLHVLQTGEVEFDKVQLRAYRVAVLGGEAVDC